MSNEQNILGVPIKKWNTSFKQNKKKQIGILEFSSAMYTKIA